MHHPNIVSVVDFNVTPEGAPYLVMEYLEGRDLGAIMRERGALPPAQVGSVVRQVASALDAAHARGIIHRDLKPDNVVIVPISGQDDLVKVIDFGVSRSRFNPRLTEGNRIMGTPQFMAPEQAQGHREDVNEAADQFALAALTYTMLTGAAPWDAFDPLQILYKVVHEKAPHLNDRLPWAERIDDVLQKALEKDPGDRFPSVLAFAEAFDAALVQDVPGGVQSLDLYEKPESYTPNNSMVAVPTPMTLRASTNVDVEAMSTASITVPIRRRVWPRLMGVLVIGSFIGSGLALGVAIRRHGWATVQEKAQNQVVQIGALVETRVRRFGEGW
jgi:serine/threonine protein kinase